MATEATDLLPEIDNESAAVTAAKAVQTPELMEKRTEADSLIRRYALLGTASGLIPVFGLDVAATTAIQTKMIKDLADVYEFDIDDQIMRTAITTGVTALVGRILSQAAGMVANIAGPASFLLGGATSAAISGFLTMEIGHLYKTKMELGQNPADIALMDIADHIITQVKQGKWDPSALSLQKQLGAMVTN